MRGDAGQPAREALMLASLSGTDTASASMAYA